MKLNRILNEQLMPRSPHEMADKLGRELLAKAMQRDDNNPELLAKKLAAGFHKAMVDAIDDELQFRSMKVADRPDKERSYGTA